MIPLNRDTTGEDIVAEFGQYAKGKTFVITGPSKGGLGAELLTTLAKASPAHFILAGRTESKISPVIAEINRINPSIKTTFVQLDLLDNASVRRAAETISSATEHIDVLINNAEIAAQKQFALSKDGVEAQFAANHLGHFLLTELLIGKIVRGGVVVNVSSMAYVLAEVDTEDVNFGGGKDYHGWVAYGRSKTANPLFTVGLQERYGDKIVPLTIDPGLVQDTQLMANSTVEEEHYAEGRKLYVSRSEGKVIPETVPVSMQQGIASTLLAALDPSLREKGGLFIRECSIMEPLPYAADKREADKLWALSRKLTSEEKNR